MMTFRLAYGRDHLDLSLRNAGLLGVLEPRRNRLPADEETLLRRALAKPIGTPRLGELVRPGQSVVIVTSDLTRPCPSDRLLPHLVRELERAGVRDRDITVVVALGLHRPMTGAELEQAMGPELASRLRLINHDPAEVVRLGTTHQGTPVEIFRPVVEASVRIAVGNLELHYFAGYSGGAKAILPGCASRATVQANHALMVQPEAAAGRLEDNPVRVDLEEGAALIGIDFVLNVVAAGDGSGEQHRVVAAVAGDVTAAHRRGCELVAAQGIVPIPELADIVLVSAGGHPKDVNLYQAQKALDNAALAVRPGGTILLLAECKEGLGNETFQRWLLEARSPDEVLARIQREFVLGGHKAAAVASVLKRASVYLVSALPDELVRHCGLKPFRDADLALQAALGDHGQDASLLVLPQGGSVLPVREA